VDFPEPELPTMATLSRVHGEGNIGEDVQGFFAHLYDLPRFSMSIRMKVFCLLLLLSGPLLAGAGARPPYWCSAIVYPRLWHSARIRLGEPAGTAPATYR